MDLLDAGAITIRGISSVGGGEPRRLWVIVAFTGRIGGRITGASTAGGDSAQAEECAGTYV